MTLTSSALSIAAVSLWTSAVVSAISTPAPSGAPADLPSELAKKGGEPCDSDSECETAVCKDGACDPCPDADHCPPPGTCTEEENKRLQEEKGKACKQSGQLSCTHVPLNDEDADCTALKARRNAANACYEARVLADKTCYLGGDKAHRGEQDNIKGVVEDCDRRIEHKLNADVCYECEDYKTLLKAVGDAWKKPDNCPEKKDDAKVNCQAIRDKIANAAEVMDALDKFKVCFNSQLSKPRIDRRAKASGNEAHCRDVLDFKEGKKLCQ